MSVKIEHQLPLHMPLDGDMTWDNWLRRSQSAALESWLRHRQGGALLVGESGLGKSHLLQASCCGCDGALYLPLSEVHELPPMALLESTEQAELLAIDDLHRVANDAGWAEALFHLFNRAQQTGTHLIFSANKPINALPILLPDLRSRLAALPSFLLSRFEDAELRELLIFRAGVRGIRLGEGVVNYILRRIERTPVAVLDVLDALDKEAMSQRRALTVPLLAEMDLIKPHR